ncbi:hypothetical protein MKW98_015809, partial [Papaver atlanticum]
MFPFQIPVLTEAVEGSTKLVFKAWKQRFDISTSTALIWIQRLLGMLENRWNWLFKCQTFWKQEENHKLTLLQHLQLPLFPDQVIASEVDKLSYWKSLFAFSPVIIITGV